MGVVGDSEEELACADLAGVHTVLWMTDGYLLTTSGRLHRRHISTTVAIACDSTGEAALYGRWK